MFRSLALIAIASAGCRGDKPKVQERSAPIAPEPAPERPRVDEPSQAEIQREADEMTAGSVPGETLLKFIPTKLGGIARSNLLDQVWASGAAYKLPDGSYANLDIQNTFHRGSHDTSIEELNAGPSLCPTKETLQGHSACIKVRPKSDGGTSIRWYLPDRLSVRIAAPTEELARKMAAELPIAELAKLAAAR
jgi:hypothetical protein